MIKAIWLRWVVLPVAVVLEALLLTVAVLLREVDARRAVECCVRWADRLPGWEWYLGKR